MDSVTHLPVSAENPVRGFPRGHGDYILLEDEEVDAIGLESTPTIEIEQFVPRGAIDWIRY